MSIHKMKDDAMFNIFEQHLIYIIIDNSQVSKISEENHWDQPRRRKFTLLLQFYHRILENKFIFIIVILD